MESKSEVANLLESIRLSYEAAHRALYAPSITAPHEFITERMEHMHNAHSQLKTLVGEHEAMRLFNQTLDAIGENGTHDD